MAGGIVAAQDPGIAPRPSASDFPAHSERANVSVGAALLTPEEIRHAFATDLAKNYMVVEVALYPSQPVAVKRSEFTLVVPGTHNALRPLAPRTTAAAVQKRNASGRDVTLYPGANVGYESGPYGRGVDTGVGLGVGIGAPGQDRPAASDADRRVMEQELSDKSLPEGSFSKPVAGYLFFPLSKKAPNLGQDLEFTVGGEKFLIPFPPQKK
jgi:hypothetical protein